MVNTNKGGLQGKNTLFGKSENNDIPSNLDVIQFNSATQQWELVSGVVGSAVQTSSNVGTGEGVALARVGDDLPFRSLIGETNRIILTGNANDITFTLDPKVVIDDGVQTLTNKTIDGDLNTISDINETQQKVSVGVAGTVLTSNGVGLAPSYQAGGGGGEANTSSNDGTGEGLAKTKVGVDLPFKSLIGETNRIILTGNVNDVTFTLGSEVVKTNASNIYDSGILNAFSHNATNAGIRIINAVGDPSALVSGDLWFNQTLDKLRMRLLSTTDSFVYENKSATLTNKSISGATNTLTAIPNSALDNLPALGTNPSPPRQTAIVNSEIDAGANIAQSKLAPLVIGDLPFATAYQRIRTNAGATDPEYFTESSGIEFVIDGGGSVLTIGEKGHLEVPFDCVITAVRLFADQTGSVVVDIWKDTYANFPPTNADTITSATPPTITSTNKDEDTTLTSWTTVLNKGDILAFNVDSVTTIQRVTVSITVDKRG